MTARRTVLSALLAAALAPAGAARGDEPADQPCTLVTTAADEALVSAGPVAGTGTLTCTVQVRAATHDGPDLASASATGTGVVVLEPREVSFAYEWGDLYVCTAFTPAGGAPRYWSAGQWSGDPGGECDVDYPGVRDVAHLLHEWCEVDLCLWPPILDRTIVCPVAASFSPGVPGVVDVAQDGDLAVLGDRVWDCPPYED